MNSKCGEYNTCGRVSEGKIINDGQQRRGSKQELVAVAMHNKGFKLDNFVVTVLLSSAYFSRRPAVAYSYA